MKMIQTRRWESCRYCEYLAYYGSGNSLECRLNNKLEKTNPSDAVHLYAEDPHKIYHALKWMEVNAVPDECVDEEFATLRMLRQL